LNKKPPQLPDIEDATLKACLAPLLQAMIGAEPEASTTPANNSNDAELSDEKTLNPNLVDIRPTNPQGRLVSDVPHNPTSSNDNPPPSSGVASPNDFELPEMPKTLAEWRLLADDDFGAFRTIDHFLGMTDAELETAAAEFPRQISGTMTRIAKIKRRLAARYDAVTTAAALLERAMARAASRPGIGPAHIEAKSGRE
jgi:hypothetical protein